MKSIDTLSPEQAGMVDFLLSDIDDTMTEDGKLSAEAYDALWRLSESGIKVIPITGRPAGWCDLIVRQWPVDAVIGENGAFAFYMEGEHLVRLNHPLVVEDEVKCKLEQIRNAVLAKVPGSRVSKDQPYRLYDLAIDFREDPPDLGFEAAGEIKAVCESFGAQAKISSIHVNTWFGAYDKLSMAGYLMSELWGITDPYSRVFFCGDSPNDEPMFSAYPLSCGVANIRDFSHILSHPPAFVTTKSFGKGFAEAVDILLSLRSENS